MRISASKAGHGSPMPTPLRATTRRGSGQAMSSSVPGECTGAAGSRIKLTVTHSDVWNLASVPPSMIVIGGGATGVQVASIFNAFSSRVHLVEVGPRILRSEDHEVSDAVSAALAASGVQGVEDAGTIDRFEHWRGVRLLHSSGQGQHSIEATLAVVAAGSVADTGGLALDQADVQTDRRGYVEVDAQLRTTAPHVFAAGDVTGRGMVVHEAVRQGWWPRPMPSSERPRSSPPR